jgi:hypothetical protein
MDAAMAELCAVDRLTRVLEDEAVPAVPAATFSSLLAALKAHPHDPGVVGIIVSALGKFAANPDNHAALESSIALVVGTIHGNRHADDARVAEGFVSLILPLSFDPSFVSAVLAPAGVTPLLITVARRLAAHLTTAVGSAMAWPPPNVPGHWERLLEQVARDAASGGSDGEEKAKRLPRIAQACAQALANLACGNEPDAQTGRSVVDDLVSGGAVDALALLMSSHADNPRLLEDCICGLSNLAFVSDNIQIAIGRSCMDAVCAASSRYNADS